MEIRTLKLEELQKLKEFDHHDKVFRITDEESGLFGYISIHKKINKIPALGATRLWKYHTEEEALCDVLRLSRLMSYKSALAGLPYTGAKAVLVWNDKLEKKREDFFMVYAKCVNELGGQFVTGTDVGVYDSDIKLMRQETPYVIGCGVDPGHFTAVGVFCGIESSLNKVFGSESVEGKSFAIQGLGKTGGNLAKMLLEKGAKVVATDIDKKAVDKAKKDFPNINIVEPEEIHRQKVDVFSPCALNGIINEQTIKEFNCKIICGSANNQLYSNEIGQKLYDVGILYAPDYVVNAGGLISVVDEFEYGEHNEGRINQKLSAIKQSLRSIFEESEEENAPTNVVADEIAEEIIQRK